jgi:penicillin-binding protein 3
MRKGGGSTLKRNKKILPFLLTGIVIWCFVFSFGCSKQPKPEDRFFEYVKLWNDQQFEKMYERLSSQTKNNIEKDEFVERYQDIYNDLNVQNLSVTFQPPKKDAEPKEEGIVFFPYSLKMDTIAGPIQFSHSAEMVQEDRGEGKDWFVNWNPSMIFPQLEEGDQIGLTISKAKRGEIIDRNGVGLAINGTVYEMGMVPEQLPEHAEEVKAAAAELLGITVNEIDKALHASWVKPNYFVPIKRISKDETELVKKLMELPGLSKKEVTARVYPYNEIAAHLIGYIGIITEDELKKMKDQGYTAQHHIGKKGLELVFEERLKGEDGARIFVKKKGETIVLAEKPPKNGETVQLTIDINVQQTIYQQLNGEAGTAVAIQPLTGETLALVSSPSFNPNDFILGISNEMWKSLQDNPSKPLLNRFNHTYAPGSTIKPIIAAIALENQVIKPEEKKEFYGLTWQNNSSWGNYYIKRVTDPKKPVNLRDALVYSDNIYFAQTALEIGGDRLVTWLQKFGFGEEIPYDYPIYTSKITRDNELKKETLIADTGYGQGQVEMSPLHLAIAYTTFLNNGNILIPKLVAKNKDTDIWKPNLISNEHAQIILKYLTQVIEDPKGTARDAKIESIPLAGKTGTAEMKQVQGSEGKENGWFVAVNTDHPRLLVVMMMENVGKKGGSHYVVPKVKKIFEQLLQ